MYMSVEQQKACGLGVFSGDEVRLTSKRSPHIDEIRIVSVVDLEHQKISLRSPGKGGYAIISLTDYDLHPTGIRFASYLDLKSQYTKMSTIPQKVFFLYHYQRNVAGSKSAISYVSRKLKITVSVVKSVLSEYRKRGYL